jgi:serine/threonine protein kinase
MVRSPRGTNVSENEAANYSQSGASSLAQSLVGKVLGGTYEIVAMLDEGGMGQLYRANHVRLHRPIAVKVLAQHLAQDKNALTRFQREAEIVGQLRHPHIVHILDFATDADAPYIVMELLQGESLAKRLNRERVLPIAVVVQIVSQVASALNAAHQQGIVHRDLKPDNVFLLEVDAEEVFVKLLDFGISKSASSSARVTGEYDLLGTPDYMAPEQVRSTANADPRADQYALACMAFEMLTGRLPFVSGNVIELLRKMLHEDPPTASTYAPGIGGMVDQVLLRAMAKAPDARFVTVQDFAYALAQATGVPLHSPRAPLVTMLPPHSTDALHSPPSSNPPVLASLPHFEGGGRASASGPNEFDSIRDLSRRERWSGVLSPSLQCSSHASPQRDACSSAPPAAAGSLRAPPGDARSSAPPVAAGSLRAPPGDARSSAPPVAAGSLRAPPGDARSSAPPVAARHPARPMLRPCFDDAHVPVDAPCQTNWPPSDTPPSTLRSNSQSPAPSSTADCLAQLRSAISDVRRDVAFGEHQRAFNHARRAVYLARICDAPEGRSILAEASSLLELVLLPSLGGAQKRITIRDAQPTHGDWTPGHFFLLSRLEQPITIEELLDLSPLTRPETISFIADLMVQNIVTVD